MFFIGRFFRTVIHYCSGINVFEEFTSIISIFYYMKMALISVYCSDINLNFHHIKALFENTGKHFKNAFLYMYETEILKDAILFLKNPDNLKKMAMQ